MILSAFGSSSTVTRSFIVWCCQGNLWPQLLNTLAVALHLHWRHGGAYIYIFFPKSRSPPKTLRARRVTWSKFHTENPSGTKFSLQLDLTSGISEYLTYSSLWSTVSHVCLVRSQPTWRLWFWPYGSSKTFE
jgi:hypothetical protein